MISARHVAKFHHMNIHYLIHQSCLNAFHIQRHVQISLMPDDEFIFIKHSNWVEKEKYGFRLTIEKSELEYQSELLRDYLATLEGFLSVILCKSKIYSI